MASVSEGSVGQVREAQLAFLNALKLAASLVVTWSIALGAKFLLPRYLGPEQYGLFNFAEAFAITFFVLATLGIETYVQKEIPLRPAHASDFLGAVTLVRVGFAFVLIAAMVAVLNATGRPAELQHAVILFGVGQLLFVQNGTFSALLHARGTVDGLSVVNVLTKVAWGAGILGAVHLRLGLPALAAAFAVAEAIRAAALFSLCRRHLALQLTPGFAQGLAVLRKAAPFFLTTLALTLYSRLDLTLLAFMADELELGWYAAAGNLASLALLLSPLVSSVLLPHFARAHARSEEELDVAVRRSLEVVLTLAIPVTLCLAVGADVWIRALNGPGYEPAALALRTIAPMFVLTYVAMLSASLLNLLGREWTVTRLCLLGLLVNPLLNLALIKPMNAWLGPGGAGVGAAIATVTTEAVITFSMLALIGKRTFDARLVGMLWRTAIVCAAVIALDWALRPLGPVRLVIDAIAYLAGIALGGAVRWGELRTFVQSARAARG